MDGTSETHEVDKRSRVARHRTQMIRKWSGEIGQIRNEVWSLYNSRGIRNGLWQIVNANPRIQNGNVLYEWIDRSYVVTASIAIRRLLDKHRDVLSLSSIVRSMRTNPHLITRKWWVCQKINAPESIKENDLQREEYLDWSDANDDFDKLIGIGLDTLDGASLEQRLEQVRSSSALVIEYADRLVAHTGIKPPDELPTYASLDMSINLVGELFDYLDALIRPSPLIMLPLMDSGWERFLEEPWKIQ